MQGVRFNLGGDSFLWKGEKTRESMSGIIFE